MKAPARAAVMERRILVNYRVDPDLLGSHPPAPFRPVVLADHAPGSAELLGKSTARPDVRMRATMAPCDAPSLPTGMMGRNENPAASAKVFGLVVAGCGVRSSSPASGPMLLARHDMTLSTSGAGPHPTLSAPSR
jgi:hypothetical protein